MRKTFTLLFICFYFFAEADYWTQKANFGGAPRFGAVGFSIGNKGYIGTGKTNYGGGGTTLMDFWEYDPSSNTWTQKADFGGGYRLFAVGFSIGNKGYIGTGADQTPIIRSDFWEYDQVANIWTQKANVGLARGCAVGFSIGTYGFLGTGINAAGGTDCRIYNPVINTWQIIPFPGFGAIKLSTGFSSGTKGYLGTGSHGGYNGFKDFWEYDFIANTWTQMANFGGSARQETCAFWICPFGYIGLGTTYIGSGTVSDFWKYDIANNTWTQVANFGPGLREMAVAFSIGNKGYVGTGLINDINSHNDFWEYTPDSVCATTGIEELNNYLQFSISPNPASEFIVISSEFRERKKIEIRITDINGKEILFKQLHFSQTKIDVSNFSNGVYFVAVGDGNQKAVKKFLKE